MASKLSYIKVEMDVDVLPDTAIVSGVFLRDSGCNTGAPDYIPMGAFMRQRWADVVAELVAKDLDRVVITTIHQA